MMRDVKILVVDDRASVCEVVSRLLVRLGAHWIETAGTGEEALKLIEGAEDPFSIAIFDIDMPHEDGLVCLRRLAKLSRRPAVILMSGKDPIVLEAAERLGESLGVEILGRLSKPVSGPELRALIENAPVARRRSAGDKPPVALTVEEIKDGIRNECFELWFQPQCDIATGHIRGAEALLRYRDEKYGLLLPDAFIKTAEVSGLIAHLTDVVIEQAAAWLATWHAGGWSLSVSVNLSKAGLDDLSFPDRAAAVCRMHDVAPSHIVLELTESSLATDSAALLDIMTRFRLKGFQLSLDDFGTGYASLQELRALPFHELKLDKQFVQSAGHSMRSRAILESSVRLAGELHMSTVAEGIETDAMLRMVASLGCNVAQGYLIGRPMPGEELSRWLLKRARDYSAPLTTIRVEPPASIPAPVEFHQASLFAPHSLHDVVLKIAHDAASPLTIVLSLSEMLLEDPSLTSSARADIVQIREAAQDVSTLIKRLQDRALTSSALPATAAFSFHDGPDDSANADHD